MLSFSEFHTVIPTIEERLGYVFQDKTLLALAFVHRSYVNENRDAAGHNERMEFLGDSVLGVAVSEYLYREFPTTPEGDLSTLRSRLVDLEACSHYLNMLHLGEFLLLGRGELMNGGQERSSILSDLFEAVIGAIFLDGGLPAVKKFLFSHFESEFEKTAHDPRKNWKAILQDWCQKKYQETPVYELVEEKGPDHEKSFVMSVSIRREVISQGEGYSKKEAQQQAAKAALETMRIFL